MRATSYKLLLALLLVGLGAGAVVGPASAQDDWDDWDDEGTLPVEITLLPKALRVIGVG